METRPPSTQRNHPASKSYQNRCPRCGINNPQRHFKISFVNPRKGEYKSAVDQPGCIIWAVTWLVAFFVIVVLFIVAFSILFSRARGNPYEDPLVNNVVSIGVLFTVIGPFVAAFIATPLLVRSRNRLSKTCITIYYFVCWNCKNEWTVTQEPPAKNLS
jgi:hypothetical protein